MARLTCAALLLVHVFGAVAGTTAVFHDTLEAATLAHDSLEGPLRSLKELGISETASPALSAATVRQLLQAATTTAPCTAAGGADSAAVKPKKKKKHKPEWKQHTTHGYLAGISFGSVLPLSAIIARNFKSPRSWWFHSHWVLGVSAWIVGTIGVVCGQLINDAGEEVPDVHMVIGWLVVALVTLQMTALLLRPSVNNGYRWVWKLAHSWTGRAGIAFGIANTCVGLKMSHRPASWYWRYTAVLFFLVALWFSKELYDALRIGIYRPPPTNPKVSIVERDPTTGQPLAMEGANSGKLSTGGLLNPRCLNAPYSAGPQEAGMPMGKSFDGEL